MTTTDEPGEVQVDLPQDLSAAGAARAATRRVLPGWRLTNLLDPVLLVVSELVGNAVRHGRPPVDLRLRKAGRGVRVDVHDDDAATVPLPLSPTSDVPGQDAESGRGMFLVVRWRTRPASTRSTETGRSSGRRSIPSLTAVDRLMADSAFVAESADAMVPEDLAASYAAALHTLLEQSHLMAPSQLPALVTRAASHLQASEAVIYLIDYEQQMLTPLPSAGCPRRDVQSVDGSVAGRAFQRVEPQDLAATLDERRLWLPLLDGVARLGVLELVITGTEPLAPARLRALGQLAHLVAELILSNGQFTDTYEWARRRSPMTLPAEMQHGLLPPLTFGTSRVVLSGLLAPAYEVGGDAFDYALNGNIAHVAVFDAVGHGLHASLLANLAVSCYRNSRRAGMPLTACVAAIDGALADGFGPERYVTAVVGELDIDTGLFRWINAGHPEPMLLRGGQLVKELVCEPGLPLGMGALVDGVTYAVCEEALQPGDRLLLVTDGVDEARAEDGSFFGRDRLAEFAARELASGLPTPEVMRRLQAAILRYQTGRLQDDATTIFVEWLTGAPGELPAQRPAR